MANIPDYSRDAEFYLHGHFFLVTLTSIILQAISLKYRTEKTKTSVL